MIARSTDYAAREWAETVLHRSVWLDELDRRLLQQVLGRGRHAAEIAAQYGVSPRALQSRVIQLADRLTDPLVIAILHHHADWPPPLDEIALEVFVRRNARKQVARRLGLTYHQIRQAEQRIHGLLEAQQARVAPRRARSRFHHLADIGADR